MLAIALGFAGPASAQQPSASVGQTFQGSGRSASSQATVYEDASGERFVLQQQGRDAYAKFLDTGEVVALKGTAAQRGDTFYKNDAGELLFRLTEQGNIVTFLENKTGMPAAAVGYVPPFANQPMPASLNQRRIEAAAKLTKLAGHDVTIFGTAEFANNEAWAADALQNVVIGVERANGLAGRVASKLEKVRLVRAKAANVSFKDGELLLGVNPDEGYGGRPSSDAIANKLTEARSSG
jgi:hypothetical protein